MLCSEHSSQGHHDQFDVGNGHARPLRLLLGILQHDDVLGDAFCQRVVLVHVRAKGDHVDGMQTPTVGIEEGDDFQGRHLCVEGFGIFEVVVPDLIDYVA